MITCPECGKQFHQLDRIQEKGYRAYGEEGSAAQVKYCSEKCARKAENRRAYQKNRKTILEKAKIRKQKDQ